MVLLRKLTMFYQTFHKNYPNYLNFNVFILKTNVDIATGYSLSGTNNPSTGYMAALYFYIAYTFFKNRT